MAIWSLTHERLERLKKQLEAKKAEFDELNSKSEKDLWCKDLDDFVMEWENRKCLALSKAASQILLQLPSPVNVTRVTAKPQETGTNRKIS